jgi:hypothetical protein
LAADRDLPLALVQVKFTKRTTIEEVRAEYIQGWTAVARVMYRVGRWHGRITGPDVTRQERVADKRVPNKLAWVATKQVNYWARTAREGGEVFNLPVSGELEDWAPEEERAAAAWQVHAWLPAQVECSVEQHERFLAWCDTSTYVRHRVAWIELFKDLARVVEVQVGYHGDEALYGRLRALIHDARPDVR